MTHGLVIQVLLLVGLKSVSRDHMFGSNILLVHTLVVDLLMEGGLVQAVNIFLFLLL